MEDNEIIEKGTAKMLEKDKNLRIDNQYYLKNIPVNIDFDELSDFLLSIKKSLDQLDNEKINFLRQEIGAF